jgi:hypothetical protein
MTDDKAINDFNQEVDAIYKAELYTVRDNGSVLRHPFLVKRLRPSDNQWTFGKPNAKTGYMEIASVRVHRIIATAFMGVPPTEEHVVDHIDTNKLNNRPENLRWVTRLENILLNPITANRIAKVCGSVEAFLSDPSKFRDKFPEPNYQWMCTVSVADAQTSLQRMLAWAKSDKAPSGGTLGQWIYNRNLPDQAVEPVQEDIIILSNTANAVQRNWNVPSEFPCCPQKYAGGAIVAYAEELKVGLVFCRNNIYSSLVSKHALSKDCTAIYVVSHSEGGIKPWALAKITFEDDMFVHSSSGSFFRQDGVEKYYCLAQGLEWFGGDTFDDNC